MNESKLNTSKPIIILVICFIGLINTAQMSYMTFSPVPKQLGGFYPFYFAMATLAGLLSIVGLWLLKKWAAWLFIAVLGANQLVLLSMGLWEVSAIIMPVIIAVLLIQNLDKMD